MRLAMLGTRGVPAHYGGFETAIEEIGRRLVERGHEVTVYCRGADDPSQRRYLGMDLVHLPALPKRSLETLSHTALSVGHVLTHQTYDAAVVFNAANTPFIPALRLRRIPVAVHVDGLEWRRAKWGRGGRGYYRRAEALSVRWADALIADAQGIADYYRDEFGAATELLSYGAPIQSCPRAHRLHELGLVPSGYHLVVARFEPENHVAEIVAGYRESAARLPLVVVGSAPYGDHYTALVREHADRDPRVRMVGGVWDQELLDQLYAGCATYLHGHSVGGTNPSLLRAMGAGAAVIAFDVVFNREVVGPDGLFFATPDDLPAALLRAESSP
jgi:glycosyltransferase involved in cell wall biosynthesis